MFGIHKCFSLPEYSLNANRFHVFEALVVMVRISITFFSILSHIQFNWRTTLVGLVSYFER